MPSSAVSSPSKSQAAMPSKYQSAKSPSANTGKPVVNNPPREESPSSASPMRSGNYTTSSSGSPAGGSEGTYKYREGEGDEIPRSSVPAVSEFRSPRARHGKIVSRGNIDVFLYNMRGIEHDAPTPPISANDNYYNQNNGGNEDDENNKNNKNNKSQV